MLTLKKLNRIFFEERDVKIRFPFRKTLVDAILI